MRDTLLYISNNALLKDGSVNPFLSQEMPFLYALYNRVYIIAPQGVYIMNSESELSCVRKTGWRDKFFAAVRGIFSARMIRELIHMFKDRHFSVRDMARLALFSVSGIRIYRLLQKAAGGLDKTKCCLYSYWLSYDAYAAALAQKKWPEYRSAARAHSYDIQLVRNSCNPYLMKRFIGRHIQDIHFISNCAKQEFSEYMNLDSLKANLHITYLGSSLRDTGWRPLEEGRNTYRILSCSYLVPIKQVHHIIEALSGWNGRALEWVHIGDGPLKQELELLAKKMLDSNPQVEYRFAGILTNDRTREIMREGFDCFINCSKVEGVPVSIMEALSFGIPVIAPKINGIPELVDEDCGILYEPVDEKTGLMKLLENFFQRSHGERQEMRRAAYEKWNGQFVLDCNIQKVI